MTPTFLRVRTALGWCVIPTQDIKAVLKRGENDMTRILLRDGDCVTTLQSVEAVGDALMAGVAK